MVWDQVGERLYETGTDHGVLYVYDTANSTYGTGVPWNGLTGVDEKPSGAEANNKYADNIKYLVLRSAEDFGATITAFTYPDEFEQCDGSAEPADGVFIGQQAVVSVGAELGKFAIVCSRAGVGHDTKMGDFSMLRPAATLLGHMSVGARAYIAAGVVVRHDVGDGETLSVN